MQEIRHTDGQIRYLHNAATGWIEFRALPTAATTIETVITHHPACDGDQCADLDYDCEAGDADDITPYWWAGDDAAIWRILTERATAADLADIAVPPSEASHEQRAFRGRLIAEGHRAAIDPNYYDA